MKALMSTKPGGPESLEFMELPTPSPGTGEVLIAIKAASANFPDTLVIRDLYQFKPPRPFAPGSEIAGVVEAVGEGVTNIDIGDNVFALLNASGGFATHAVIDATRCAPIPPKMSYEEAASFMMAYATAYYALKNRAHLQPGDSLFITGASGGVGSAAIELGKAMGVHVIAGVSSENKAQFCRDIGADDVIIYPKELDRDAQKALASEIKDKSNGGVNVVYDAVGGNYAEPSIRALAWEGRYLVIGFPAGIPTPPTNLTLLKNCQIVGVFWGAWVMRAPQEHFQNMQELAQFYHDGKIKPRITRRFPLEQASQALTLLEQRQATGKIVITMEA
ncbi:MAG: NADPH:quinone oxidoreductase family protein [bacterium]